MSRTESEDLAALTSDLLAEVAGPIAGLGVDVEDLTRWRAGVPRLDRLFAAGELAHAGPDGDPDPVRLAGTWCAKEAVVKALAVEVLVSLREVEIVRAADGRPHVVVAGRADISGRLVVSIAHSASTAVAVAALRSPGDSAG